MSRLPLEMFPDYWLLLRLIKAAKSLLGQRSPLWCMKKKIYSHMLCWTASSGQHSALRLWQAKTNRTPDLISDLHKRPVGSSLSVQQNKLDWEAAMRDDEWWPDCAISMCLVLMTDFLREPIPNVDLLLCPFFSLTPSLLTSSAQRRTHNHTCQKHHPTIGVTVSYLAILTTIERRCQVKF